MRRNILLPVIIAFSIFLANCTKMEDNYEQYLGDKTIYSPKVTNLEATVGLKQVLLKWDNPVGDVAKKILVDYQDSTIVSESIIDSILLMDLEVKGYDISVYTLDAFENRSIPETVSVFPNGEQEE